LLGPWVKDFGDYRGITINAQGGSAVLGNEKPLKGRVLQGLNLGAHYRENFLKKPHNAKITLSQFQKGVKLGKKKLLRELP
jgi:hypothetical protein